jgi:hypothetical protein
MKIVIEQHEKSENELKINPSLQWKVTLGDKYAEKLNYDEMLGLVTTLTMPTDRPCIHLLRTKEEHAANSALWGRKDKVEVAFNALAIDPEVRNDLEKLSNGDIASLGKQTSPMPKTKNKLKMIIITIIAFWIIFVFTCQITCSNETKSYEVKYNGLLWVALDYWSIQKYKSNDQPKKWIDLTVKKIE